MKLASGQLKIVHQDDRTVLREEDVTWKNLSNDECGYNSYPTTFLQLDDAFA